MKYKFVTTYKSDYLRRDPMRSSGDTNCPMKYTMYLIENN